MHLKEAVIPWKALTGEGFVAALDDLMGDPYWSSLFLKDCIPFMLVSCWTSSWRTAACGRTLTEEFCGTVFCVRYLHWSRGRMWGGRIGRNNVCWTYCNPHSPSLCAAQGDIKKIGSWTEPRKKGEVEGRCLKICFYFSLFWFDWQ